MYIRNIINSKSWSVLLILLVDLFLLARLWNFLLDDSFFGFVYAKNFSEYGKLVFNLDEIVIGTSSPLMAVFYGLLNKFLKVDIILSARIISVATFIALSLVVYKLFLRWFRNQPTALIGVLFFILQPFVFFLFTHESLVYFTLSLWAFYLWANNRKNLVSLILGVSVLIRTESVFLWIILTGFDFLRDRSLSNLFKRTVIFVSCFFWWFIFSKYYYGVFFSNSFFAKSIQTELGIMHYVKGFLFYNLEQERGFKLSLMVFPVILIFLFDSLRQVFRTKKFYEIGIILLWSGVLTSFYIITKMPFYHWFAPQIYLSMAIIICGGLIRISRTDFILPKFLGYVVIGLALAGLTGLAYQSTAKVPDSKHALYKEIGLWFKDNTPSNSSISYGEIGVIKYYSDRKIVDYIGMITPELLPDLRKKDFKTIIEKYKPDYFIYNSGFAPITGKLSEEEWFNSLYIQTQVFKTDDFPYDSYIFEKKKL